MFLKLVFSGLLTIVLLEQGTQPQTPANSSAGKQAAEKPTNSKDAQDTATASKPSEDPKENLIDVEKQIVEQTNAQRAHYGLPPLAVDRNLIQTARSHAAWMTNNRTLQHTTKPVGENIAMGQRSTDEAVGAWMASPGHRANILNNSYKRIGVAAYRTPDGTIYWCQQFLP